MKNLSFLLLTIVFGLNTFAQKVSTDATLQLGTEEQIACKSGPDKNFMIVFRGNWGKFNYALLSNVSTSTSTSNIISINQGSPGIVLSPNAFLNTTPCFTLGFIKATVIVYNSDHAPFMSATVQLNSIFYYDYPVNNSFMYYEYYIPDNAWQLYMVPCEL
ncbi:MAG TPA: hypothetical protein DIW31_02485 [Bacteroidales bacterium]|nr:hypothetical protein [Bacteroidales bacterium]